MRNQYFQLQYSGTEAFLHIFPALDGGEKLKVSDVTNYLNLKNYSDYNIKEITSALNENEKESHIRLGTWDGIPCREMMDISVSLDKMKAICRFYPPSQGGELLDAKEIIEDLRFKKIVYGISQEEIGNFISNRQYCKDYVFAMGTQPVHGKDAKIEYFFNVNINLKPKRNDDGSVDYKELNTINHIKKGDLLARLIKEDPGVSGRNILGDEIKPRTVKSLRLEYGKNISINDDKTEIYSDVTGHVSCFGEKVFVSNVYEVPADVDNSVGNIDYDGSVSIKGNVKAGFIVKAKGDIIVEGVIEGAHVESEGQVIVKRGIHGMQKGFIKARTNVMAKYIENATVVAGGYVEAEIIMNSKISVDGEVRVQGKKGLINGGTIRAGRSIEAMYIGSEMGTFTTLEVGIEPERKQRYIELNKEVAKRSMELEDLKVIIDNYAGILKRGEVLPKDKLVYFQKLVLDYKAKKEEIEPLREEMRLIHVDMMQSSQSYIAATRTIYPGATIAISDLNYIVREARNSCKFKKQNGEIAISGI